MKKKLFFGIGLIVASIIVITLAVIVFINLPDKVYTDDYTVKQSLAMTGCILLGILGLVGLVCGVISISPCGDDYE